MKQLSKKWKIFIITTVVLIGSIYGWHKINNRNKTTKARSSGKLLKSKVIINKPICRYNYTFK